ncbi:DUF1800 domain-containing protein [Cupriavidus necator]|uniref:DUF1800 domain-containing protein n=1 Tax=Cupriavidus necator (strain ATCC 17699 / DSM 428 / KCTC 22496 / NCIMB 10442 / H16 / Stanier 337) TaxID=381666 RepID=Q0JZ92_CUPNH|nr:DUF1800 domain-containing protein [Cupriavidus necator]QCC05258.1 DUF1800 domain-containing protein [Cupriavidus necator H16]QQB81214.1 DUF1800 domain-containing protein [Cupriavidus necator]WKA45393.1 DUF1800 domain-containing protein [Cupriavidus necator]CAJ96932.1 conserved hypothetical protein [Cupriavidus necator H16]
MNPAQHSRQSGRGALAAWRAAAALALAACLAACAQVPAEAGGSTAATDLRWLNTVTYGADQTTLGDLRRLGRKGFLDQQLTLPLADPPELAAVIAALPNLQADAAAQIQSARDARQRIDALPDDSKQQARQALNAQGREIVADAARRHLLRALYSPAQLREQMTWFWMNHFNVYSGKGQVRLLLADYEERAIRPHALGRFRDLLMASVTAPAMLVYLDNTQSSANRINENYARELMELHTMGVSGGPSGSRYTQQDVQELARVLTGVGVNLRGTPLPRLPPARAGLYRSEGLFEFNPARHDFGAKMLLGQRIEPAGFDEVARAVSILAREPATARFISAKLAAYFIADNPPPALVERMAQTFTYTDGDIAAVLRTLFLAPELDRQLAAPTRKFKDPMVYVVSSMRLAYEGRPVTNLRPVMNWLNQLGEPLYGHVAPDGYPSSESAWASSGQMVRRFEIARAIGSGPAGLFAGDDARPRGARFPMIGNKLYFDTIEATLGPATRAALGQAESQAEWNTVLLGSPEWMQR